MEDNLISVIVPIYNREKFIERCLDSIINQSYTKLEILLIDDGSSDKSGEICDDYAKRDSRIIVLHTDNKGLSSARNKGLEMATGQYIAFVDSDDWIETNMYEDMLKECLENDVKLVCCGRYDIDKDGKRAKGKSPIQRITINSEDMLKMILKGKECDSAVWDKLYEKSIWKTRRFPENRYYEDVAIMYKIVSSLDRIRLVNKQYYNYVHHGESITSSKDIKYALDYYQHAVDQYEYVVKKCPKLEREASFVKINALSCFLKRYSVQDENIKELYYKTNNQCKKELLKHYKIWLREDFSIKQKILFMFLILDIYSIYFKLKQLLKMIKKKFI